MDIRHEILNFDSNNGSIVVRYFTNDFIDGFIYNIDLPIIDGRYPDEIALSEIIKQNEPKIQIQRFFAAQTAIIPENLKSKLLDQNIINIDKAAEIRILRNQLLAVSDYTQLPDVDLSLDKTNEWKIYRQKLRDITKQNGFPDEVEFPTAPNDVT